MNDIQQWNKYEKNYKIRDYVLNRIVSRHITMPLFGTEPHIYYYGGKMLHGANWTSKKISKLIDGDDPFMVARFGNTELNVLNNYMGRTITGSAERYQEISLIKSRTPSGAKFKQSSNSSRVPFFNKSTTSASV